VCVAPPARPDLGATRCACVRAVYVRRRWKAGDVLGVRIRMGVALSRLPDSREEYSGLAAVMVGPHLMAGLTHDARALALPVGEEGALDGLVTEPHALPAELVGITVRAHCPRHPARHSQASCAAHMSPACLPARLPARPPASYTMLPCPALAAQTAANSSLYVRADRYHAFQSVLTDGGDALDATWVVRKGCQYAELPKVALGMGGERERETGLGAAAVICAMASEQLCAHASR
jgi:uncharacterized protein